MNLLSGERRVLRADVVHDAGRSISPAVDMGQVTHPMFSEPKVFESFSLQGLRVNCPSPPDNEEVAILHRI